MHKILLLEDNIFDADLIIRKLNEKWPNVKIDVAKKIEDARKLMQEHSDYSIALFDLKLPDGDGLEFLEELRSQNNTLPIIALTSKGTEETAVKALKSGANNYISKKPGFHKNISLQLEYTLTHSSNLYTKLSVLYIERHKSDIDLTLHYFKNNAPNIHINVLSTGEQLIENISQNENEINTYDVILLDYNLPGINALDLCKYLLQEKKYNIPVVIVTGEGSEELAVESLKIGAEDYIVKQANYLLRMPSLITNAYYRKQLEKQQAELKQSEIKYRLLAEYASDWEYWINPEGKFIYISPACKEICGYSPGDFINDKELIGRISNGAFQDYGNNQIKNYSEKSPINDEFIIHCANGENKWISRSCRAVYDDDNNYLGRRGVNRDITERKRSEQIQKAIYNISNSVFTTNNLSDFISNIQNELKTIIDTKNFYVALYDKENNTIYSPFMADEKDSFTTFPAGKTLTKYVIDTKKPLLANEELMKQFEKEGKLEIQGSLSKIWLGVPLKIDGEVTGVFAVQSYEDENAYQQKDMELLEIIADQVSITIDRKEAELNLISALRKAEESDRLKSAFLANMSHEIRTPMNGILGFTNLLKKPHIPTAKLEQYISIIEKSGTRMLNTINDLINISKIEANQVTIHKTYVSINTLLINLYDFFKKQANDKGLNFSYTEGLQNQQSIIITDEEKLFGVLSNLIKNALTFTSKGSINFGYKLISEAGSSFLRFYVKDTGIGIQPDRHKMIFDRFVQADLSRTRPYEGAGLGLSISEGYVNLLQGNIWVESEEGQGSVFYFTIPYSPEDKISVSGNSDTVLKNDKTDSDTILLIVDDDDTSILYYTALLEGSYKNMHILRNGLEAVNFCKENKDVDIILMDIKMPVMDGLEATRKIREFNKDVRIIAQTAFAMHGDKEKSLEAGCNAYLSKPVNKEALLEALTQI